MTEQPGTVQSLGVATAVVVIANVAIYLLPVPIALVLGGGASGIAHWYTNGGYFMHLIMPACVALIGIAGTAVGLSMAHEAVATAPPDMVLQMWSMALAIAGVTRQYGLAAASLGCLSMVIGGGMAAFVRRGLGAPGRGAGAGLLTAGVGVAAAIGAAAAVLVLAVPDLGFARPVILALVVLFGTVFAALGTRGIAALAQTESAEHQSLAGSLALTSALGLVLAVVAHGVAMIAATESQGLEMALASPPGMDTTVMVVTAVVVGKWTTYASAAFALAALLVAFALIFAALPAFGPWITRRAQWAGLAALLIVAVIGGDALLSVAQSHRHESLIGRVSLDLPEGVALPRSSSDVRFGPEMPLVALTSSGVTLDGRAMGAALSADTAAALAGALAGDAPEEPNPVKRFIPGKARRDVHEEEASPKGILGLLAQPVRGGDGTCGAGAWRQFGLALDGSMSAEEAWRQTGWLRDAGACEIRLLTESSDTRALAPEARALFEESGLIGDLIAAAASEKNAQPIRLLAGFAGASGTPPLDLTLTIDAGQVTVSGSGGSLDPPIVATSSSQVDREALMKKLAEIKDAFPDERRIYLAPAGTRTTVQHVVDAMDAAREVREDGNTRPLFDEPIWIGTTTRRPSFAELFGGPPASLGRLLGDPSDPTTGIGGLAGLGSVGRISPLGHSTPLTPTVMGALPKEVIQKVISHNRNQIRYCYEVSLSRAPNLAGRIDLRFIIAASGSVAKAQVDASTMGDAQVEQCIIHKVQTWKFPQPAGGGIVEVRYPFIFKTVE